MKSARKEQSDLRFSYQHGFHQFSRAQFLASVLIRAIRVNLAST